MEFNLEVRAQNGKVYTNASDLLPAIQEGLKAYDYVVDENNYKQAKTDRASLNNLVKVVSDNRKHMTNNKYPFDLVFEERYLNKSVKPKEIEESLNNKFLKAEEQLSFIEASLPDDELQAEQVIQLFCKTLDLSKATERINEIKAAKAKLQEKVNAQIEQSKQAQSMNQTTIPESRLEAHESQSQTQVRRYCVFRFEGSMEELQAFNPILNQFIREHNVKVTIVEKGEC